MNWRDPADSNYKAFRDFTESGGFGSFARWHGDDGFETTDSKAVPSGGYHKGGEYFVVDGTDERRIPPGYEVIGKDDPFSEGSAGEQTYNPGRLYAKRSAAPQVPQASQAGRQSTPAANTAQINEAYERASKARKAWQDHAPRQDFSLNPIERAAEFGRKILAGQPLYSDYAKEKASADATAIGEITQNALANFQGAVPRYDDPKVLADYYINRFNA